MARDYKPRRKPRAAFSGWIGVALGLGAGLAVAALVYVKDHKPPTARHAAREARQKKTAQHRAAAGSGRRRCNRRRTTRALPTISTRAFPSSRWWYRKKRKTCDRTSAPCRRPAGARTCCRRAHTRISPMPIGCAPSSRCRESSRRCRKSPWTTTPGTASASDRFPNLDQLNRLRTILRKADVDVLVIRVGD